MRKATAIFFPILFFTIHLIAQTNVQLNSAEIFQALKKLNTVGSVLYIAAHPDDENTRLLAYLANERKLRTGYLSLTRGDGGQNLIGKEQGELLGLIRTQELLAARRVDHAEQFFTRANDFGYSKNPEETFSIWNKDSILADVVWTIRRFKPDIIICRFPTTGEGGHGHHTASAILATEAFDAAADPKRFPEQLKYTEVWQAKRLFWNTFNFGGTNTTSPDQLKIDVGVFNPLMGKSYGEIAAESRSNHKSQGFGSAKTRGEAIEFFKQLKGDVVKMDLFEGINQSWTRLAPEAGLQKIIEGCIAKYNLESPEKINPDLVNVYKQLQQLDEKDANIKYWKTQKLKEAETVLLNCSGLWMEATAGNYAGIPGNAVDIMVQIVNRNKVDVKLNKITFFEKTDTVTSRSLKQNEFVSFKHKETLPLQIAYSNPYWLNEKHGPARYIVKNQLWIGNPENDPAEKIIFDLDIQGLNLKVARGLEYKFTDPVKGEIYRPFEILPPATVNVSDKVFVFTDTIPKTIQFSVKANTDSISGTLIAMTTEGWKVEIEKPEFKLNTKGDVAVIEATVRSGKNNVEGKLQPSLKIDSHIYSKSIARIEYDHVPYQFILSDAEAKLVPVNLTKTGINIGYIPGAGDEIPSCLKQIGYHVTVLTDELLASENLSKYDAIVSGIRAYNTNDKLQLYYSKLMEYVSSGGNLVVQYNTNSRIGPVIAKIGPYPFTISRDRVTDEKAEVRMIKPNHAALTFPNTINNSDFDNWVQERGIYFANELDNHYETILSMNDPNEKASDGSLIIAKYGKGNFVYTGLVFFRELPAGNSGAYRLFVNLLSLPRNN